MNFHRNGREFDGLLLPSQFVRGYAVDLLRRDRRWGLEKRAAEFIERSNDVHIIGNGYIRALDLALRVVGIGDGSELNFGFVGLRLFLEESRKPGGVAGHDEE